MDNYCKPPKATSSELRLRNVLRSRKIPLKTDQVIWYTSCDCFTPDLIIGRSLIIEVDGKVHDKDHRKTLDRIRQRALENMGYTVHRVKNESIRDRPNDIANEINDIYTILSDTESKKKETTITELKKPLEIEPIPKDIQFNLAIWATEFNKKLNDESWSVEFFRESLSQYHPELAKNQCAMEKLILVLHGLNLKTSDGGNLDFEYSLKFFKKSLNLLKELFPKNGNMAAIHLKNIFNESAPGFFKNLIFKGGPNINTGLVSIKDKDSLNFHIDNFNKYLSKLGITVEPSDIIQECKATLQKLNEKEKINYNWLVGWMNITN
jgi:very-short-patch-repair endonuclease